MAAEADMLARGMAGLALSISAAALYLNYAKHRRDITALDPQIDEQYHRAKRGVWRVTITVQNPRKTDIRWQAIKAIHPPGLEIRSTDDLPSGYDPETREFQFFAECQKDGPATIAPNAVMTWTGWARIADQHTAKANVKPKVIPIIEGFTQRPWRFLSLYR